MEKEVKKKKRSKISIAFKNIWKRIKKFFSKIGKVFKRLILKFKKLPKYVKNIVYIWLVIIIVIILLIVLCGKNKLFIGGYNDLEESMNVATLKYVKENEVYPAKGNKLNLDLQFLTDEGYIHESEIKDKTCSGYSNVYYDDVKKNYVVKSFLKCRKYKTAEYDDYKK